MARTDRATREEILAAALAIAGERGAEALTVRSVTARAHSSTGSYYHHFGDKGALLSALIDLIAERAAERIDQAASLVSEGAARLAAMVYTGVITALETPRLSSLLVTGDVGDTVRNRVIHLFVVRTQRYFSRWEGAIEGLTPDRIAALWQGSIFMVIETAISGALTITAREAAEMCARWNLRALGYSEEEIGSAIRAAEGAVQMVSEKRSALDQ